MANLYTAQQVGLDPNGNYQQGGWYNGRQYWGGQFSDAGVINPLSDQVGAGQVVSAEVNAQSAQAQGVDPNQFQSYINQQNQQTQNVQPAQQATPAPQNNNLYNPNASGNDAGYDFETGLPVSTQPTLNLQELYKNLNETNGISQLEDNVTQKTEAYNEAQKKINDNPWLSEAKRTGRLSKLTTDYENSIKADNDALAMKKADTELQLNLATQQFDINSQQAQQALDQFNVLLNSGALAGASGQDIANITRATGISSSMIQSAIKTQTAKNIETSVTTVDDGTSVYSVVINSQTGEVINKQVIGNSKPEKTSTAKEKDMTTDEAKASVRLSISDYLSNQNYQNQISPEDLYRTLLSQFPLAYEYIDENWTPEQIRIANGETNPYN